MVLYFQAFVSHNENGKNGHFNYFLSNSCTTLVSAYEICRSAYAVVVTNESRSADAAGTAILGGWTKPIRARARWILTSLLALGDVTGREIFLLPGAAVENQFSSRWNQRECTIVQKKYNSQRAKRCELHRGELNTGSIVVRSQTFIRFSNVRSDV